MVVVDLPHLYLNVAKNKYMHYVKPYTLLFIFAYVVICISTMQAQHKTITTYYPAFDSVGMRIPVELEYEVLVNDTTVKDGHWVRYSQEGDTLLFCQYSNDIVDGIREEHYGDGHVKSRIYYRKGERIDTAYFWEFNRTLSYIEIYTPTSRSNTIYTTRLNTSHNIVAQGYLTNDLADSTWKEYYPDGTLKSIATFKNGYLNGWVETFYPNGNLLQKAAFKNQELDGKVLLYYSEGTLKSECEYKQGEQNGLLIEYYNDETVKTKSEYKNNTLNGLTQRYYANGKLATEENYRNGVLFGFFKTYFDNGQLESVSTLEAGKKQGSYMEYNKAGTLILETGYKAGVLHGENKAYYDNGNPMHKLKYDEGKKVGKNYYYYNTGKTKEINIFNTDKTQETVDVKRFNENEQLSEAGTYAIKNSQDPKGWIKEGQWLGYYNDNQPKYKELYANGKKHLDQWYYFENGKVKAEEHYTHGLRQAKWISYYEDGTLKSEIQYKNNSLYGPFKEYNNAGILIQSGYYTGGKKTGDWKYFNEKGSLEKTEHYKNDLLIKTKVIH